MILKRRESLGKMGNYWSSATIKHIDFEMIRIHIAKMGKRGVCFLFVCLFVLLLFFFVIYLVARYAGSYLGLPQASGMEFVRDIVRMLRIAST